MTQQMLQHHVKHPTVKRDLQKRTDHEAHHLLLLLLLIPAASWVSIRQVTPRSW